MSNKPADLQSILNSLNGQRPASEVIKELNSTIGFLNNLKSAIEDQGKEQAPATNTSHYYGGNSFGGDVGAQYRYIYEELPE
ncbi:hypothetical protein ACET9B_17435 [Aeromonas veronii]|uniref:hypothetical protein n=1 Tax=Aeromonas veronii TaxID=654 RepID=UPI001D0BDADE|nr:hypothetical protein [Aeromonas veronii]MCC0089584.1 hypothetical protein [Aeromonas veronii]